MAVAEAGQFALDVMAGKWAVRPEISALAVSKSMIFVHIAGRIAKVVSMRRLLMGQTGGTVCTGCTRGRVFARAYDFLRHICYLAVECGG